MRDQKTDLIRYRYNIVAEDGHAVIRAVPVRASRAAVERELTAVERHDVEHEHEHVGNVGSAPVLRRLRDRLLER